MSYFIDDPRTWRISKSGFSIKTGWSDEKQIIAKYPGAISPLDADAFGDWLKNAEDICNRHNAALPDELKQQPDMQGFLRKIGGE